MPTHSEPHVPGGADWQLRYAYLTPRALLLCADKFARQPCGRLPLEVGTHDVARKEDPPVALRHD